MKKIILTLGMVATVAIPTLAIISCTFEKGDSEIENASLIDKTKVKTVFVTTDVDETKVKTVFGTTDVDETKVKTVFGTTDIKDNSISLINATNIKSGIQVLDPSLRLDPLQIKNRDTPVTCWHRDISQDAMNIAYDIRKTMNENSDIQWHTYGDPILDGTNAVRLAIHNDLNGDNTLKEKLGKFIEKALPNYRNIGNDKSPYHIFSKGQINDWLDGKKGLEISTVDGWKILMASKDVPSMKKAGLETKEKLTKNYHALTLSTTMLYKSEHRVQETDWLGEFDNHGFGATIEKIKNKVTEVNEHPTGEFAKAPNWEHAPGYAGEDYMFPFTYNNHTFGEGADFISGLLTAINILYDSDDAHHSTGHRSNLFGKGLTTLGWSRQASCYGKYNWNNFQYVLIEAQGERITDPPIGRLDEIAKANPFLNKYSLEILKWMSPMEYLNKINVNAAYIGYRNYPFMKKTFENAVNIELFKPHKSFKELNDAIKIDGGGFGYLIDLKEPNKMPEFSRFARPQKVGRPDTWIKSYDYDGGGTLTGFQYGYSLIDETLFDSKI